MKMSKVKGKLLKGLIVSKTLIMTSKVYMLKMQMLVHSIEIKR